jgi:hypothetical protein
VETVIDRRSAVCGIIRNNSHFLAICVDRARSNVSNQSLRVLKTPRLTHLLNFSWNCEHSDVWFLGPANQKIIGYFNARHFSFTLWEHKWLLYLAHKSQQVESVISGNDEGIFWGKKTA